MRKFFTFLVCAGVFTNTTAQTFNLRSRLNFEAAQYDASVIRGNFIYCTGVVADTIPPNHAINVFSKYSLDGSLVFNKIFKGDSGESEIGTFDNALISTKDNGFALTGYSILNNVIKCLLIKYDSLGNVEFYRTYSYPTAQTFFGYRLIEGSSGYYIQGTVAYANFDRNLFVIKTDLAGNLIWRKFYGSGSTDEMAAAFIKTSDNRLLIAGQANNRQYSVYQNYKSWSYLLLLDTLSNVIRDTVGIDPNIGIPQSLIETQDGNFVYCTTYAVSKSQTQGIDVRGYMAKIDTNLNLLWEGVYSDTCPEDIFTGLYNVVELNDGNLIAVGANYNPALHPYHQDGLVIKTNASGSQLWSREYRGVTRIDQQVETNILYDCDILNDGSIVACGIAQLNSSSDTFPQQAWLLRIDADGCMDAFCGYTGVEEVKNEKQAQIAVYPNPFASVLNIALKGEGIREATFTITGITGNIIYHKEQTNLATGYTKMLDLSYLPNGVYFVSVSTGEGTVTKRVVKE